MADVLETLISKAAQAPTNPNNVAAGIQALPEPSVAPATLGETFVRGVQGGAAGLGADARYFKGLAQTLVGNQEGAETTIRNARLAETQAAEMFDGIATFGEFLEEPTVGGFFTQIAKGTGQIVPSAISSIASGGTGAVVGVLGKSAVTKTGRAAAKKLVQDGLIKTMRGTATPDEKELANGVYTLFRNRAANAGFITGAGVSEFVPLSGQNLSEALETGEELDPVTAFRAAAIGVPQAAVGVGGEIGIAKLIGKVATQRGKAESSGIFAKLGRDIGGAALKSGAIEGTTEVIQEGMAVANRFALDPEYDRQDAALRLGEAAFVGFFGGGALGGGAAAPASAANSVFRGAEKLIEQGREAQVAQQTEREQAGVVDLGLTTPESTRDIAAQFNAMEDPNNNKQAVWVSGNEDTYNVGDGANGVTTVSQQADGSIVADPDGDTYAVFVPGRGTLMSKNVSLISEVLNDGASDRAIAKALGYSATMPPTSDQVVQVTDSQGNVVHEEATDSVGLDRAIESAKGMVPAGGKWEVVDLQAAMERRKQRFEADSSSDTGFRSKIEAGIDAFKSRLSEFNTADVLIGLASFEQAAKDRLSTLKDQSIDRMTEFKAAFETGTEDFKAGFKMGWESIEDSAQEKTPEFKAGLQAGIDALKAKAGNVNRADVLTSVAEFEEALKERLGKWQRDFQSGWELGLELAKTNTSEELFGAALRSARRKIADTWAKSTAKADNVDDDVVVRDMQVDPNAPITTVETRDTEDVSDFTDTEFDAEEILSKRYQPRNPKAPVEETAAAREAYEQAFNESTEDIPSAPNSILTRAVDFKNKYPDAVVSISENADGTWSLNVTTTPDTQRYGKNGLPLGMYVDSEITQAKKSKFKNAELVSEDGKRTKVNLQDLVQAGKRINETEGGTNFNEGGPVSAAQTGLSTIMGQLLERGLRIEIDQLPLDHPSVNTETIVDASQNVTLGQAIQPRNTIPRGAYFYQAVGEDGEVLLDEEGENLEVFINPEKDSIQQIRKKQAKFREFIFETRIANTAQDEETEIINYKRDRSARVFDAEEAAQRKYDRERGFGGQGTLAGQEFGEIERFARNALGQTDLPLNEHNMELGGPDERTDTGSSKRARRTKSVNRIFGIDTGTAFSAVLTKAINALKLKMPVTIVTKSYWNNLVNKADLFDGSLPNGLAEKISEQISGMGNNNAGKYIGFQNHHLLVVNEAVGNELAQTIAALHELGHALFREERRNVLENEGLRKRLYKAFLKAKNREGAPAQYEGPNRFEEWYADQVAMWGLKLAGGIAAAKPRNQVESYFKQLVMKLRNMWNSLRNDMQRRFSPTENFSPDFDTYIQEVVNRSKETIKGQSDKWTEAFVVRELESEIKRQAPAPMARLLRLIESIVGRTGVNLVLPADNALRNIGSGVGKAKQAALSIAKMMYSRSGEGGLGFLQLSTLQKNEFMNQLETLLGTDLYSPENQAAFDQALSDTPTTDLDGKARQIRLFLERMHDEYISQAPGVQVRKLKDFFPVRLDFVAINENQEGFARILFENQDPNKRQKTYEEMLAVVKTMLEEGSIQEQYDPNFEDETLIDPYDDNVKANLRAARRLTKGVPKEALKDFLKPPQEALGNYIRDIVKYVEWQRAIKDENGNDKLAAALKTLEQANPEFKQQAEEILDVYLGYQSAPLSPLLQKANSWLGFLQILTTLAFAAISSFSELAGPIIRSREFSALRPVALRAAIQTMNRKESQELARQLGLVTSQSMAHAIIDPASQEYMGERQRRWTDGWFKVTGLEWFTRFTREFGANMSREFILYHARKPSPDSERYLKELGLTAEEVLTWDTNEFTTPVGRKVKLAMQKFTESSVIRPNAAERPIWASDPRFMLIFQLKGFAYAYGKVIVGGLMAEIKKRKADPRFTTEQERFLAMTSMLALTGFAAMPFTMLGLELKEFTKFSLAAILPGVEASDRYFRSDSMDWGSYMFEITDRAGLLGPWSLLLGAQTSAQYGGSAVGSILGPSVESFERLFSDGLNAIPDRMIPVYSQL